MTSPGDVTTRPPDDETTERPTLDDPGNPSQETTPELNWRDIGWKRPVIGGVIAGTLGMVPIWRAPFAVKAALAAVPAGAAAAVTGLEVHRRARAEAAPWKAATVAIAAGGVIGGAGAGSFALDRGAESLVRRLGARRPRILLGIAGGILHAAVDLIDAAGEAREARTSPAA